MRFSIKAGFWPAFVVIAAYILIRMCYDIYAGRIKTEPIRRQCVIIYYI